ncbi:unnamed protein product [Linum trigynum]|uniref:Uncharacterized protein n=1 Tax=Linum trigynum TaxID=586398 RepID=A0AAV2FDQ1_9ROSI
MAGGVGIWWHEELTITCMDITLNHVDIAVEEAEGKWRFTGIYGWPTGSEKWRMWDLIMSLRNQWDGPWLCGGNFNQFYSIEKKRGDNLTKIRK